MQTAGLLAAVEQAADGIVITDPDGRIQYVNPAFTAMTGYSRPEAVGQYPRILKSGRQTAAFYEDLWSTIRSGRVWHGELVNRRKDGTFYHEEMRITGVLDPNGEIVNYIAIKHDVSARLASSDAERFLAAIVQSSDDGIVAWTPEGVIPHLEPRGGNGSRLLRRGGRRAARFDVRTRRPASLPEPTHRAGVAR